MSTDTTEKGGNRLDQNKIPAGEFGNPGISLPMDVVLFAPVFKEFVRRKTRSLCQSLDNGSSSGTSRQPSGRRALRTITAKIRSALPDLCVRPIVSFSSIAVGRVRVFLRIGDGGRSDGHRPGRFGQRCRLLATQQQAA